MQKNNGKVIVVLENAKKRAEIVMPHVCAFYQLVAIGEWWGFPKFYATDDLLNRKHTDQKRPLGREAASVSAHMTPRPSEVLKSRAGKRRDEIRLINARETIQNQSHKKVFYGPWRTPSPLELGLLPRLRVSRMVGPRRRLCTSVQLSSELAAASWAFHKFTNSSASALVAELGIRVDMQWGGWDPGESEAVNHLGIGSFGQRHDVGS